MSAERASSRAVKLATGPSLAVQTVTFPQTLIEGKLQLPLRELLTASHCSQARFRNLFHTGFPLLQALRHIRRPFSVTVANGLPAVHPETSRPEGAFVPGFALERLGDATFCADHGIRYPYLGGSMAKGISSATMVEELGRAGMLGFFGAAGLPLPEVEAAISRLVSAKEKTPCGFNLIHSPQEPELEASIVDLYLRWGIDLIEASAFLNITLPLVRYRVKGIRRSADGSIVGRRIIAKVSREELAAKFFSPPPENFLRELLAAGEITPEQAALAGSIPMAQDATAEADSGGHTDNRPAIALFPTICGVRDRMQEKYRYERPLRVGLAGGIATPLSAAAAFAMGAGWIMTGSVNQACVESGTSADVRSMLAETRQADVAMAPAADMFEMGVTVQVLKRGTMFSMRASRLYEIYRAYDGIEQIPSTEREKLEKTLFQTNLEHVWSETRDYFLRRDPRQVERAERDPKHRMALVFRWYLGQASHWANRGESSRKIDYQVWCGPAMGAFNEWATGSFLERPENRRVATIAFNLLHGATVAQRLSILRCQGVDLPPELTRIVPLELEKIKEYLH